MLKIHPFTELSLLAGIGGGLAVVIDFLVSRDGSFVRTVEANIDQFTTYIFPPFLPTLFAVVLVLLASALSIFYFRPLSRKGAIACGFGTVAGLAIFFP